MSVNSVFCIGRLTKDPAVNAGQGGGVSVAKFTLALDRGKDKDGNSKGADFPNVVCFGKTAELAEKYLEKGRLVCVIGRIQTGSYEGKDGKRVYTTDIVAEKIEFLDKGDVAPTAEATSKNEKPGKDDLAGFMQVSDEEIPF